jgi:cytoskeletal protein RodZ
MSQAESSPGSLGAHLRSLREAQGGSLEDMARSTRVGIRHLEALEEERLADLPSPVFVRGFIRAYCGFLRESPDPALSRYQDLLGERLASAAASSPPRPRGSGANRSLLVGLGLLVVLGLGLIGINLLVRKSGGTSVAAARIERADVPAARVAPPPATRPHPPAPVPAAEPPRAPGPAPASVAPPPVAPPATVSAKAAPSAQRLTIRAVEATWVRVQADEGHVAEELLPPGASREWAAERRFLLTIGNAGGVELTLNGKALPPLGAKGTVIQRLELPPPLASGS